MKKLVMMLLAITMVLGLTACGSNDSNTGGNDKPVVPETETIEITIDNWKDYFEIVEGTHVSKNSFDEPENIYPISSLKLKEGYTLGTDEYGNTIDYELAIEYSYTAAYYNVEMDVENCTLTIGDLYEGETPKQSSRTTTFYSDNNFYPSWNSRGREGVVVAMEILSDIEIIRIQGSLTIQK